MNEVDKLVEWATEIVRVWENSSGVTYKELAEQILSHPDLALIDRGKITNKKRDDCLMYYCPLPDEGWKPVIPLAEALKE